MKTAYITDSQIRFLKTPEMEFLKKWLELKVRPIGEDNPANWQKFAKRVLDQLWPEIKDKIDFVNPDILEPDEKFGILIYEIRRSCIAGGYLPDYQYTDNPNQRKPFNRVSTAKVKPFRTAEEGASQPHFIMFNVLSGALDALYKKYSLEFKMMSDIPRISGSLDILLKEIRSVETVHSLLRELGAKVHVRDISSGEVLGGPREDDSLFNYAYFAQDSLNIFPDHPDGPRVLVPSFRSKIDHGDITPLLKKLGYDVIPYIGDIDGGDFEHHHMHNFTIVGNNPGKSIKPFRKALGGMDIVVLPKTEASEFYHLDLFCRVLPQGEILVFEEATTRRSIEELRERVGNENVVSVSRETAEGMGINLQAIGNTLIMPTADERLTSVLNDRGYKVVTANMLGKNASLCTKTGGPHCLTIRVSPLNEQNLERFDFSHISETQEVSWLPSYIENQGRSR